jgi:hypothetical protein
VSLDDCFARFESIVSSLRSCGPLAYSDNERAKQFLYALDASVWGMKIIALEESADFATLDTKKLFSKLKFHKLFRKGRLNHDASLTNKTFVTSTRVGGHVANPTNTADSSTLEFALSSLSAASDEKYESIPDDERIFVDEGLQGIDGDEDEPLLPSTSSPEPIPASTLEAEAAQATTSSTVAVEASRVEGEIITKPGAPSHIQKTHPSQQIIGNMNERVTHSSRSAHLFFFSNTLFVAFFEPRDIGHTLSDSSWVNAMHEELENFERNQLWTLVDPPRDVNVIRTK